MINCPNCGTLCQDGSRFCENCGTPLEQEQTTPNVQADEGQIQNESVQTVQPAVNNGYNQKNTESHRYDISPRNIVVSILLSIVTCGIYGIYWMIKLNDEINQLSGEVNATSGGKVFLFTLITCGIYGLYWQFKMGERVDLIKGVQKNTGIIYLVLSLFGLGVVGYCLMQDTINKVVQ